MLSVFTVNARSLLSAVPVVQTASFSFYAPLAQSGKGSTARPSGKKETAKTKTSAKKAAPWEKRDPATGELGMCNEILFTDFSPPSASHEAYTTDFVPHLLPRASASIERQARV